LASKNIYSHQTDKYRIEFIYFLNAHFIYSTCFSAAAWMN